MSDWQYEGNILTTEKAQELIDSGYVGFVYMVTDLRNGKKYIGKKKLLSKRKLPPLKGKTRKRTKITQSDWQDYFGSSEEVKTLLEENGRDIFKREVLHVCKGLGELSYMELHEQIVREALLKPDEYYNAFVGGKISRSHLKNLIKTS